MFSICFHLNLVCPRENLIVTDLKDHVLTMERGKIGGFVQIFLFFLVINDIL